MYRNAYNWTIYCLAISVPLIALMAIPVVLIQRRNSMELVPLLAPILAGLTGLLATTPRSNN